MIFSKLFKRNKKKNKKDTVGMIDGGFSSAPHIERIRTLNKGEWFNGTYKLDDELKSYIGCKLGNEFKGKCDIGLLNEDGTLNIISVGSETTVYNLDLLQSNFKYVPNVLYTSTIHDEDFTI